ncbi:Helix-turn-helix domain-containing protein [Streptomyces sp. 2224.1]|uniref:helix-turn-helix domain-containing protein n=1 Tax=unclassified Streptomyces TaxID=2593676 RepID=UPI000886EE1F|nr:MULTISPECIES: helix-turn-helix transcriptional regulator [unclassified Streptomyces]PBC81980.1 helix-turn-helix protein [Streptomyces sp. 2321.6]SDR52112.1 Helix-turn-helix domain-containing protein [Streptomyces sp. KS_16]SEC38599.1 Helix-turn-helix domain-containing protein [Streptomyces sp. 2133.1]SEC64829.1 Helix-turn-helix domain-containing protein [Streptomyces sp. 2224.1]SNC67080.1 Helix-turn-helix domain-containing protein [Streptomyces sp. 2114.4]
MKFTSKELTPYLSARHFFGAEQRRHRERAKLSLVQLAEIVNFGKSTLARVEAAELMPPPELPAALDAAFGTEEHFHGLYQLAKREAHPDQYRRFMDFEARAEVIEVFEPQAVPGLLQTMEYARDSLGCQEDLTKEQVEERVNARMSRQERLHSAARPYRWVIIDEAVLRRHAGGRECMHKQLARLLEQVDTPDSKVQVMPFSAGPYPLMGGALNLLTLPDGSTMAYEEGIEAAHLHEGPEAVKKWRRRYEVLRANALSLAESADLIRKAMEDYKPCDTQPS